MPKTSAAKKIGASSLNGVALDLFELDAKTKDPNDKDKVTEFKYQFPRFTDTATPEDLVKALEYKNGKGEVIPGISVLRDYVNVAMKNEARSKKLNEINTVLALRADPEKAMQDMIQQMVVGFGVPREIAEANVKAILAKGNVVGQPSK
jgi:hypothetical protein